MKDVQRSRDSIDRDLCGAWAERGAPP